MDLASGYHNFRINESQQDLMGIAVHISELPTQAIQWLRSHPSARGCEAQGSGLFYFTIVALPFGLAPSCAVFSDVVTALAAACAGLNLLVKAADAPKVAGGGEVSLGTRLYGATKQLFLFLQAAHLAGLVVTHDALCGLLGVLTGIDDVQAMWVPGAPPQPPAKTKGA